MAVVMMVVMVHEIDDNDVLGENDDANYDGDDDGDNVYDNCNDEFGDNNDYGDDDL